MSGPSTPAYTNIAMSLSGGGYRAAGFHLGALAELDRRGLRPSVRRLSTVSGGTFTGIAYALALSRRQTFLEYFKSFYEFLRATNLLRRALDDLVGAHPRTSRRRHDVITSLADVYSTTFLTGEKGPALFGEILDADGLGLDLAAFNATEFRTGTAFRFQHSNICHAKPDQAKIGNGNIWIKREDAARIRLGDIVAASSCFPVGFEPIAFPDDFVWIDGKPAPILQSKNGVSSEPGLPLMDGGVFDNEGIGTLLLADERKKSDPDPNQELDLFIISDVGQPSVHIYDMPKAFSTRVLGIGRLRVRLVKLLLVIFAAVFLGAGILLASRWIQEGGATLFEIVAFGVPTALCVLTAALLACLRWRIHVAIGEISKRVPQLDEDAWDDILSLSVDRAANMLWVRATSLRSMAADIFPRRIRSLAFGTVYNNDRYDEKRVSNLVYELTRRPWRKMTGIERPTPALQARLRIAAEMETTLWFTNPDVELPALVISGQATLCYNLLKHLHRESGKDINTLPPDKRALWDRLAADWNTLREDPEALLRELLDGASE